MAPFDHLPRIIPGAELGAVAPKHHWAQKAYADVAYRRPYIPFRLGGLHTKKRSSARMKTDELDRLVAAGTIREIDREQVRFIVRCIVEPPERPDDPLSENEVRGG